MRKAAAQGPANYLGVICFCCECLCPHHTNKLLKKGGYREREEGKKKKRERSQQVDLDYINGYTLLRLMNIGEQVLVIY